ncbi:MAG: RNA-binding protein [Acidobacteria bacterium]|nr:RNA-binding protein [Acidobacteriota bacterium]
MPALLCAVLSARDVRMLDRVFPRAIDNLAILRAYVKVPRSGVVGRKSLGTVPKRLVNQWLASRSEETLFRQSAGQSPSLPDLLRMVHPKPASEACEAFYGYPLGRPQYDHALLPELVRQYERLKSGESLDVSDLPLPLLTSVPMSRGDWTTVAQRSSWQAVRMNLNAFARHGVFSNHQATAAVAAKLRDPRAIDRAKAVPYQLLAAFRNAGEAVPAAVRDALQDAMEVAVSHVPRVDGKVYVCPEVSGSMLSPVTGDRGSATAAIRCIDVAALMAAAVLRANLSAEVLPFAESVKKAKLNSRDSVMTNADKLAALGGGGTNCSAPVRLLNQMKAEGDLVIFISDNESWIDAGASGRGTALMREWDSFRDRNPKARLVCIDIQPNRTAQAVEREDVLNVGGFSDHVFPVVAEFAAGRLHPEHWVREIESVVV